MEVPDPGAHIFGVRAGKETKRVLRSGMTILPAAPYGAAGISGWVFPGFRCAHPGLLSLRPYGTF